jgi:uncharacterized spore protein YtfJ
MNVKETISSAEQAMTVKRVFGEPYEKNGLTVIPAARIGGGAGGGGGEGPEGQGRGEGSGFGISAKPAGAFVIKGDKVRWQPSIDVNRIILGAQIVAIVALFTARAIARIQSRDARALAHALRRVYKTEGGRHARKR